MRHAIKGIAFILCTWAIPASALELTGITLFECDENGSVIARHRYNAGPKDAAWDIFLYEGENNAAPRWLNDPASNTIRVLMEPGTHTFTFHTESGDTWANTGINLFFDGRQDEAAISAMAAMSKKNDTFPAVNPNGADATMGLPITDIPGAGTLQFDDQQAGFWVFSEARPHFRVSLESFRFSVPPAAGNLDLVGPDTMDPSGKRDFVGQITLKVETVESAPPALLGWLATQAGMTLGGPDKRAAWAEALGDDRLPAPFSFAMGEISSEAVLARSTRHTESSDLEDERTAVTTVWTDPETGLEIRWEGVEYRDFNTVEWTVYLKNTGNESTPIIAGLQGIDTTLQPAPADDVVLHYNRGDSCTDDSFEPLTQALDPGTAFHSAPDGGRPTNGAFPYLNLRAGDEGVILAVGWPGQWAADIQRTPDGPIPMQAGQELTHFSLEPGEYVRTPLIVLQFTTDNDWIAAQNTWRQWMIRYNIPKPKGERIPLPLFAACSSHQFAEMTKANEQNQIEFIDSYLDKGLEIDYWWMDAGWYVGAAEKGWTWTGTWEVDQRPHRFPNGLRAVSDHAHSRDVDIIVWFEPERVAEGTWLTTEHPEWVFGGAKGGLLNLGDPDAWDWLVDHIDGIITDEGIDLYRQDYNIDPLHFWRDNDAEDRQGITENKYVTGYLAYWDELRRRHPDMLIDSCASGGRRNDLETMRRAIPLLRSDYLFEPAGQQAHTHALAMWLPIFGTGYNPSNTVGWGEGTGSDSYKPYMRRSNMCPANIGCFDFRADVDDALIMKLYREWREIGPDYYGDYYPLTAWSLDKDAWIAWQFHNPGTGDGFVQAFRREDNDFFGGAFRLRGLDAAAVYEVTNFDAGDAIRLTGSELMEHGLDIAIKERPGAAVVRYRKVE